MGTVIRGGTVVTATDINNADVLLEGETISALAESIPGAGHDVVDASGCYVFPGGIDPHTHLDMPFGGTITADDFASGTLGAAMGGTTSIVDFALHQRGNSLHDALKTWHKKAAGKAVVDYAFHLTIADGRDETMNEVAQIIEREGVNSFKVFMAYKHVLQVDDETIFKLLKACAKAGGLVQVHAENGDVIEVITKQAVAEGKTAPKWHALTRPVECEGEATHRAIRLAEIAGAPLVVEGEWLGEQMLVQLQAKVGHEDVVLVDRPGRGYGDDYSPWLVAGGVGDLVHTRAAAVTEEGILAA